VRLAGALAAALAVAVGPGAAAGGVEALRVCADPFTMPYSNRQMEGFENKIAEVLARELEATLEVTWWPIRRGILRAMNAGACDLVIGVPKGYDPLLTSRPYYRSAYEIVTRRDGPRVTSLDDPALRTLKVGVQENSPAHEALAARGIIGNVVGYMVNYDLDENVPGQPIADLASGKLDVAILWGPLAGYYVKRQPVPMEMVPILDESPTLPFVYDFSVGVRRRAKDLVPQIDAALARRQADIREILEDYGVPLVAEPPR
jgi:mxaJ protein